MVVRFPSQYYKKLTRTGQEVLDKAEKLLVPYHKTTKILESGLPAEIILYIAQKDHYDLIIVSSRGLNSLQKLFLGSVSNNILSLAPWRGNVDQPLSNTKSNGTPLILFVRKSITIKLDLTLAFEAASTAF